MTGIKAAGNAASFGRPLVLTPGKLHLAKRLSAENKDRAVVARMVGDPATLRRTLKAEG
jgi:hypothetical protein